MGKRRANGEGCITKFRNGYRGKLCHNGKSKYVYGKTRKDVAAKLQQLRTDITNGIDIFAPKTTLSELIDHYISAYTADIRPATRQNYEGYRSKIQNSPIAGIAVCKLKADDFQTLSNFLYSEGRSDGKGGLSAKTIHNIFNFISGAMKIAQANGLIVNDPSQYVNLPRQHKIEKPILSTSEVRRLIDAAEGDWAIGIYILANTGLRSGECLGLRADCMCVEDGIPYLDINHSLRRVKDFDAAEGKPRSRLMLTDLKTDYSRRKIPLSREVANHIEAYIAHLREKAKYSYGLFNDNPFLVCNEIGNAVEPSSFRKYFNKTVEAAGLPKTTTQHTLRHSRCSHLIQQGCSPKLVSLYCGHSDSGFTLSRYCHYSLSDIHTELEAHEIG